MRKWPLSLSTSSCTTLNCYASTDISAIQFHPQYLFYCLQYPTLYSDFPSPPPEYPLIVDWTSYPCIFLKLPDLVWVPQQMHQSTLPSLPSLQKENKTCSTIALFLSCLLEKESSLQFDYVLPPYLSNNRILPFPTLYLSFFLRSTSTLPDWSSRHMVYTNTKRTPSAH